MLKKIVLIYFLGCVGISFSQELDNLFPDDNKDFEFKIVPYVNYNRNIKLMLGALPMTMFKVDKKDEVSPKSLAGVLGVYTTNQSYFFLGFANLYLLEDKWRARAFILNGNLGSQIYLEDHADAGFYDFSTITTQIGFEAKRYIFNDIYLGLGFVFGHYKSDSDDFDEESNTNQNSLSINLLSDKRDDVYYPTSGHKITVNWRSFPDWFGNSGNAEKILLRYNKYFAHKKNVIAARFNAEFGLGDVKFEQQVVIGGKDIRGYSSGKIRGDGLFAVQGEYRWKIKERLGLVGFVGLATIYGSVNPSFDWDIYPGVGGGFRYKVFEDTRFNIGMDIAVGKDDWGLSFRLGEIF